MTIASEHKRLIIKALSKYSAKVAAEKLGISSRTLLRYKKEFKISTVKKINT